MPSIPAMQAMHEDQSATGLLRQFMQVQQQRAARYNVLHQAFRAYCAAKQDAAFRQTLQEATAAFSSCSQQVISVEASLKQLGRADLAALLRAVQEQEREKLRLTLALQSLRQAFAFETFSWQAEEDDVDILEPRVPRTCGCGASAAAAAADAAGNGSCAQEQHQHQHYAAEPPEPTQAEYEAAVREAELLLDGCVRAINDKIDEVREVLLEAEAEAS